MSLAHQNRPLPGAPARPPRWLWLLLLLISLAGITNHELWTPDEPREAAITLAMRRTGELAIPRLAGEPFVEKPPLAYIVGAGILALSEACLETTAALRLSSALWGLATLGVTFLLARRLAGPVTAAWSVAALATMPGFIQVTHWLLVDNALMFMIAASLWLLHEAYSMRRPPLLAAAGIAVAGAFLVKGLIGPLIIGLGWLGLALGLIRTGTWRYWLGRRSLLWHVTALLLFGLLTGIWMLALRLDGGPELWREWFWDNHFGRFSGQAHHLGHIRGPFYYVSALAVCLLPWLGYWLYGACRAWRCGRGLPDRLRGPWPLLLGWAGGGLLLLTISSTKREIYLSMLLPALAIITGLLLQLPPPRWLRRYMLAWQALALVILAAAVPAPLVGWLLGWRDWSFGVFWSLLALLALAAAWWLVRRAAIPWLTRWLAVTALAYVMLLSVAPPLLDNFKNYGPGFRRLAAALPPGQAATIGAWKFDETTRAGFYYYCDLVFTPVSDTLELSRILSGDHPRLQGIITCARRWPPDATLPTGVLRTEIPMGHSRRLMLIRAAGADDNMSGVTDAQ